MHVTLNSTVTPATIDRLAEMLQFYLDLKPNDIKLMPIAQLRERWSDYSDMYYEKLYPQLKAMIPDNPEDFVMLRNRIEYLVENRVRGYHDEVPRQCYLMCDERLVGPDGKYYPCYINYREGGKCLGSLVEDAMREQTYKIRKGAKGICGGDICSKFCADITARYNKCIDHMV